MRYVSNLATVLFVIAVPVLVVTANIRFLLGDVSFYERGLRKYDAVEATGISLEELDRASAEIIRYFEDDAETLRIIVVEDGQETSLFNSREIRHMEDVKRLVRFVFRLNEVSLAFVVIYIAALVLWSRERSLRRLAGETLVAIGLAFVVLIGTSVFFAILGFHDAWDQLHRVVFPSGFWQLNPRTDSLIQMFPEEFWAESTLIAGGLSLGSSAVLVILAASYLVIARGRGPMPAGALESTTASVATASDEIAAHTFPTEVQDGEPTDDAEEVLGDSPVTGVADDDAEPDLTVSEPERSEDSGRSRDEG